MTVLHRIAALALTLFLMVEAAAARTLSVTFINPGGTGEFWGDVASTMKAAAHDLDIALEVINTNRDRINMVEAARQIAERAVRPDYVVLVNELQQAPAMLQVLEPVGVPVFVLLNRLTDEQRAIVAARSGVDDMIVGSIVPDNEMAGFEMAMSLIDRARNLGLDGDGISMLALLGDAATPAALERQAGLMRAVSLNDDVEIVRAFPVMWNEDIAFERTRQALARLQIDAIWAANDQISFGAQRAAEDHGGVPGQTIAFVGLNWSEQALYAVRDGRMTMSHGGHFFAGAWAMVMIRDLADGRLQPGEHLRFAMSAIHAGNVDVYLDRFDRREWDAIDFAMFSLSEQPTKTYDFSADAIVAATRKNEVN